MINNNNDNKSSGSFKKKSGTQSLTLFSWQERIPESQFPMTDRYSIVIIYLYLRYWKPLLQLQTVRLFSE